MSASFALSAFHLDKPVMLYRYVGPQGPLREQGEKVLAVWAGSLTRPVSGSTPVLRPDRIL